jgi:hypothetical protein
VFGGVVVVVVWCGVVRCDVMWSCDVFDSLPFPALDGGQVCVNLWCCCGVVVLWWFGVVWCDVFCY